MAINTISGNTLLTSGSFPPARAASTGSPLTPTTGGLLVVDGVHLVAGDRVLCKDETSAVNNGIYAASTGPWTRTSDATTNTQFFSGMAVTVALGAVNAGLTYICTTTDDPVVVGTSLITFVAQSIVATAQQMATSTTSFAIGTGSKTFTVQAGKAFFVNQWVLIQETSNPANQMLGQITAYSGTSLTVSVVATGGSGTHADWTIVLTNSPAAAGYQPPVGTGNVTGPGSSTAGAIAAFADSTGKVLQAGVAYTGGIWTNGSPAASISRLDRLLVSTATQSSGMNPDTTEDWLETLIPGSTNGAQLASISPLSRIGVLGGSRTSDFASGEGSIAVAAFQNNDSSTASQHGWAFYGEAWHNNSAAAFTTTLELDIVNKQSPVVQIDPYGVNPGHQCTAMWIASGGSRSGAQIASAAMVVLPNGSTFDKGIIFQSGSLTASNALALVLPAGYQIGWYTSAGVLGPSIQGNANGIALNKLITIGNGSVGPMTMGSAGPPGSHAGVQEWLVVSNGSGTTRYIPMF